MKRIISIGLSLIMLLVSAVNMALPVAADSGKIKEYVHDGYVVEYNIVNEWTGNRNVRVTVTNTGWEYLDTDEDGIPDIYEKEFGTDPNKADTDDDGLTDYEEIYLTDTDPLVYNSFNEDLLVLDYLWAAHFSQLRQHMKYVF